MAGKIIVQKFGGSSLADINRVEKAAGIIFSYAKKGDKVAVVVSAMGDTTDDLIAMAKKVCANPSEREMDMLVSTGEQISAALLAMSMHKRGVEAISFTGPQIGIVTDTYHTKAKVLRIETSRIRREFKNNRVVIITGYQGISTKKEITTLGRGGSDLSAVALAVALSADICQIYTDVDGIYTSDPRLTKEAKRIPRVTFDEMLELAARGAQVMQTRAVEVAKKYNMPIQVLSSFTKKGGTLIMGNASFIEKPVVRGLSITEEEAKITICAVPDRPGIAARVFNELAKKNVNVDMIVQNVSHKRSTDISFTVLKSDLGEAIKTSKVLARSIKAKGVLSDDKISKVSIVGVGMKSHSGVAARCFSALAKNKINIEMISTSEISISCVVSKKEGKRALNVLHKEFKLGKK